MNESDFDADDREAGFTVGGGLLLLLGGLFLLHIAGLRFNYGVSGGLDV